MKKIAVIGCTGSIGRQTLDIVRNNPDKYKITGLSCASHAKELWELSREFSCKKLGIASAEKYAELKSLAHGAELFCGDDALTAVMDDADVIVVAVVGMIGLKAVMYALERGKTVALANKESLVAGGSIVTEQLKLGGKIYPVDSEHSAVWQSLQGERTFKRIILTASGGPFYFFDGDLSAVTPEQAVKHPNWSMGKKISVDSATMMNKGLEIIEARWLFNTTDIDYVIHPESVVHSLVEFNDGSIKAQASFPDMRLPIQYALSYPEHNDREYKPLSLPLSLRFLPPDEKKFPAPKLAKQAIMSGGNSAAVLNAANEAAVKLFLDGKIPFTEIVRIVQNALSDEPNIQLKTVDDVFGTHNSVYNKIYCKYRGV